MVGYLRLLRSIAFALVVMVLLAGQSNADAPKVVVSIAPLHSLVAGVMDGVATPDLLISGATSPHFYTLKPTDAQSLQQADVIFWFGSDLETFLVKPVATLGQDKTVIQMNKAAGLETFPMRDPLFDAGEDDHDDHLDRGHQDEHDHENDRHGHHHHGDVDPHTWLSTKNAKIIVAAVTEKLVALDAPNKAIYQANRDKMLASLDQLQLELEAKLKPVANQPFISFHDAYQYFEQSFGLKSVGMVVLHHDQPLGAKRIKHLRHKIAETGARCIFTEPQFNPKKIAIIVEGLTIKTLPLDPLGASLAPGKMLYNELLKAMADSFAGCLG